RDRVLALLEQGIPTRPARFIQALQSFYNTPPLAAEHFPYPEDLN
ncbi:elongation factor P hydroxylase, partial [Serratia marcescens]